MESHIHLLVGHRTEGICGFNGEFFKDQHDPPCYQAGEFVITVNDNFCSSCKEAASLVVCDKHAHLVLERYGSHVASVVPCGTDRKELQKQIDRELEEMLG